MWEISVIDPIFFSVHDAYYIFDHLRNLLVSIEARGDLLVRMSVNYFDWDTRMYDINLIMLILLLVNGLDIYGLYIYIIYPIKFR